MKPIYHEGELAVQAQAGVQDMASRVGKSIRSAIPLAAQEFLSSQPIAVLSSIDHKGRVWASLLSGKPGFMQATSDRTIRIEAMPSSGDPLAENILANDQVGMIVIEFATRRRMRINGTAKIDKNAIHIYSEQVYSNCPKYIQARTWESQSRPNKETSVEHFREFSDQQQAWIQCADTFFIGSHHKDGGPDASHRGGNAGFIHVLNKNTLRFPDYTGNTMFQTLGNIAVNPNCGLLFIDFDRGSTLQVTGTAKIIWDQNEVKEFENAERAVEFCAAEIIEIAGSLPLSWEFKSYSPHNPPIK
jgi:uncharacterized protein